MKRRFTLVKITIPFLLFLYSGIALSNPGSDYKDDGITISGRWFLKHQSGEKKDKKFNYFNLKRGYIIIKKEFSSKLSARITPDISMDKEGDGAGDIKLRLKYCYLKYKLPEFTILSQPYLEFGLVHRPWLDFEEKINRYRVQGTLFLERSELLNSADFGMLLVANIGGKLDNKIQNKIGTKHTGKFGSFGIGVFNGGGYHAIEQNTNKVLETRLTLRPFHGFFPGLLFSYFGAFGKGNTELAPDWVLNSGFVSLENRYFVLTGTYYEGKGNSFGSCIDENNRPLNQSGYSAFSELKLMCNRVSIFGRYDFFAIEDETGDTKNERYIVGTAYHFERGCKILLDYDYGKLVNSEETKDSLFELAIEIVF